MNKILAIMLCLLVIFSFSSFVLTGCSASSFNNDSKLTKFLETHDKIDIFNSEDVCVLAYGKTNTSKTVSEAMKGILDALYLHDIEKAYLIVGQPTLSRQIVTAQLLVSEEISQFIMSYHDDFATNFQTKIKTCKDLKEYIKLYVDFILEYENRVDS